MESKEIEYQKFLWLVEQMRINQRDYFKTRSRSALNNSKELEKQVDKALNELKNPSEQVEQLNLLDY
jgi:hypothetical protein